MSGWKRHTSNFFIGCSLVVLLIFLSASAWSIRTYRAYPIPSKADFLQLRTTGVTLLDRHGQKFFSFDQPGRRTIVPLQDIPATVTQAVVAAEDKDFWHHPGFSIPGLARSMYLNSRQQTWTYGGSTITQQVAKNILLSPRKSINRKLQEIVVAYKLERKFSKEDILEMYLNTAYFGANAVGIEEAAHTYFNKPAKELTLAEASLLVGLLPAPTALSPLTGDQVASQLRQAYVLDRLVAEHYISEVDRQQALHTKLVFNTAPSDQNIHAPHFALMVRQALINQFGEAYVNQAGLTVTTTLDLDWQLYAEQAVKSQVATLSSQNATNGALVAIDPSTGEIRALVGSTDWWQDQFGKVNMASTPRQPGSSFKPIVYTAGLEQRIITPTTILEDKPTTFGTNYRPQDYDGRYRGPVLARYALANSLNIPAVQAISKIGPATVSRLATRLGISTMTPDSSYNLSLALGTNPVTLVDLTNAYATFANQGIHHDPQLITTIQDKFGKPVKWPIPLAETVLTPEISFLISSMLSDDQARATTFGKELSISRPAAVKTGTTQTWRDAWTVGYTPQLAVGVWVGNNDNRAMKQIAGALGAAPLWRDSMEHFLQDQPVLSFTPPTGVVAKQVCKGSGLLTGNYGGYTEYFLPGTEPTTFCRSTQPSPDPASSPVPETVLTSDKNKPDKPKPPSNEETHEES